MIHMAIVTTKPDPYEPPGCPACRSGFEPLDPTDPITVISDPA
ncbi:MAG TPA: hypothetical protein VE913_20505 [Longimicrobium sp.]|nr:hypothetical protein [Longimicrobium sp.]